LNKRSELPTKPFFAETLGVCAAGGRQNWHRQTFELLNRASDGVRCVFGEKHSGSRAAVRVTHRFENAAATIGNDRNSAGLRFDRRDSKILFGSKEKRSRPAEQRAHSFSARSSDECDVGS
jgi:hypothetical protein